MWEVLAFRVLHITHTQKCLESVFYACWRGKRAHLHSGAGLRELVFNVSQVFHLAFVGNLQGLSKPA